MSAEVLRRAAALMRERAEVATEGPWRFEPEGDSQCGEDACCSDYWDNRIWADGVVIAESHLTNKADSTYIASWHPAVALAVADLLEVTATWVERDEHRSKLPPTETDDAALSIARAYLGESS